MANDHRTLQQFFTKLILNYIRFMASDAYPTDGRNKASRVDNADYTMVQCVCA